MFPPEIFDLIFRFLHSDASALVACCEAHLDFAQLIEPGLYAHINVYNDIPGETKDTHHLRLHAPQLAKILSDSPHIANYIRSINIELSRAWVHSQDISFILKSLLRLEKIAVRSPSLVDPNSRWHGLAEELRETFVACISTSSMKSVCFQGFTGIPLAWFENLKGVRRLTLSGGVEGPDESYPYSPFPRLDSITLCGWREAYNEPLVSWARRHFHRVRSLGFHSKLMELHCQLLPQLLRTCSESLTTLDINFESALQTSNPGTIVVPFDLSFLSNLERLTLRVFTVSQHRYLLNGIQEEEIQLGLIPIVRILEATPPLEYLTLNFYFHFLPTSLREIDWFGLDTFFSETHSLHSSKHTSLFISAQKHHWASVSYASPAKVLSSFSCYVNVMRMVTRGALVIEPKEWTTLWEVIEELEAVGDEPPQTRSTSRKNLFQMDFPDHLNDQKARRLST